MRLSVSRNESGEKIDIQVSQWDDKHKYHVPVEAFEYDRNSVTVDIEKVGRNQEGSVTSYLPDIVQDKINQYQITEPIEVEPTKEGMAILTNTELVKREPITLEEGMKVWCVVENPDYELEPTAAVGTAYGISEDQCAGVKIESIYDRHEERMIPLEGEVSLYNEQCWKTQAECMEYIESREDLMEMASQMPEKAQKILEQYGAEMPKTLEIADTSCEYCDMDDMPDLKEALEQLELETGEMVM